MKPKFFKAYRDVDSNKIPNIFFKRGEGYVYSFTYWHKMWFTDGDFDVSRPKDWFIDWPGNLPEPNKLIKLIFIIDYNNIHMPE